MPFLNTTLSDGLMKRLVSDEQIVESYKQLLSAYKVADKFGLNWKTVYNALARSGVMANGLPHYRMNAERYSREDQAEMLRMYESGIRIPALVKKFGGSFSSAKQAIIRMGGKMKPPLGRPTKVTPTQEVEICAKYRSGMSYTAIAHLYSINETTARKILIRGGVEIRTQGRPAHGLPTTRNDGYVYVLIELDDPMISMSNARRRVLEHRLVMARSIGRPLLNRETVHHVNGDRGDNRLENLQLRIGRHGKGAAMQCLDCGSHRIGHVPLKDVH